MQMYAILKNSIYKESAAWKMSYDIQKIRIQNIFEINVISKINPN